MNNKMKKISVVSVLFTSFLISLPLIAEMKLIDDDELSNVSG